MRLSLLALPFAAAFVSAGHHRDIPRKIKESIQGPPRGWLRSDPAPPDRLLELKIALTQPHFPILEKHLWAVSNPNHERYGAYMSKEETEALMAPHPGSLEMVDEWLSSYGIEDEYLYRSSAQDWVTIRVPVALAEKMLDTITIDCLRQIYNAVGYNTSATNGNQIAIASYLEEYANNQDLQQFFQLQNPVAYGSNYTFVSINGGLNNQSYAAAGIEANLDTQFAFGLTYPTPATFYSTGGRPPYIPEAQLPENGNEPYAKWLDYVLSQEYLPQTISTSFADDEQTGTKSHNESDPGQCFSNDGTNKTMFIPTFPSACPYITSVGGTNYVPETAALFSTGGFSNYFSRPDYQNKAVTKYLETLAPGTYDGLYNPNGRAFPDVAAQAFNFSIVYQGRQHNTYGTSCASPAFASFVSMLNDARISARRPPLGFLNQWLYEKGYAALNDITVGNNPGCGTEGFNATIGWDPVTGLGTPNFEKLLELAMAA
ncbi:peptidase S8/S53 domain-containing protein [Boletus edulis BED1]|uniref:Peptidase S8/S53 domain-containing protein n=1 Tax=Boletus edulis BED1 TaxID=1328754 RepID=A0AAD4BR77_BOLED|nr:peptidase S8/S53 domain-containing protein [Boletus edulis BED1]